MGDPKLLLSVSLLPAFYTFIHDFTSLDWQRTTTAAARDAVTHKQTLLFYSSRSVNLGSTLAFHMTEVECEISAQTFMRADLHYITSVPHHGRLEWEQGVGGGAIALWQRREAEQRKKLRKW